MKASSPTSLSELFLGVSVLLSAKKVPIAVATLTFAMLLAVASAAVQFKVASIEEDLMAEFSLNQEALRATVDADLAQIATMDVSQFMQATGFQFGSKEIQQVTPTGEHSVGLMYMQRVAPFVVSQLLYNIVVLFVAAVFFLLLFTRGKQSPYDIAIRLPSYIIPMCGLILWVFVRSLIWIPLVGPAIAIYMLPRLCLAPVYFASGEARLFQSVHLSMQRSSGHWLALILRFILIAIVAFLILWPMLVLVVGATLLSIKLGYILLLLALVFIIAFQCASLTVLATMMA